jgi:hypothetical protein
MPNTDITKITSCPNMIPNGITYITPKGIMSTGQQKQNVDCEKTVSSLE